MKWFLLTGYDVRADFILLHDLKRGRNPVLQPRFEAVDRCRVCGKFNEQQILDIGFDVDRIFRLSQDILPEPIDFSLSIVTQRFVDACNSNNITGVDFIPCGKRKSNDRLYLLWATHRSMCHEPVEKWSRGNLLKPGEPAFYTCHRCGRPEQIVGFPHKAALEFPHELTISVPSIPTEMKRGVDFRFFCSDTVRKILKAEKIKGCCFSDMEQMESRMAHHQAVRVEIEARGTEE